MKYFKKHHCRSFKRFKTVTRGVCKRSSLFSSRHGEIVQRPHSVSEVSDIFRQTDRFNRCVCYNGSLHDVISALDSNTRLESSLNNSSPRPHATGFPSPGRFTFRLGFSL